MSIVRLCLVIGVVTVLGVFAVAEQVATIRTGYEISRLRVEKERLLDERRQYELSVGRLQTPEALQSRSVALHVDLVTPDRPRVVRVRPAPVDERVFAGNGIPEVRTAERRR